MRSSIACARCRRSKIKCINNGTDTICVPCHQNHRECTYPVPPAGAASATKRSEHPSGTKAEGEGDAKRARKRDPDAGARQGRHGDDPLESPQITFKLWRDIYSLFTFHYSTDLPFLHEATFFDRIKKMQESGQRSRQTQILLLGMLSLTARFIPELVSYPYPVDPSHLSHLRPGDPLNASEFYAHALEARLDAVTIASPSLDTIQALLMLGLYNWGMCRGMRSWMWVGNATRMAYAMGLSEEEPDNISKPIPVSLEEVERLGVKLKTLQSGSKLDSEACVLREIKRRTMWSCFILDRYLSSGRARPQMSVDQLQIQLPCSEEDFRFGTNVKTEFLNPRGDSSEGKGTPNDSNLTNVNSSPVLSVYIKLVEIWGKFSKWSCTGGRREETNPPWDERTEFYKLRKQLDDFQASLPPRLTFTSSNLAAHVGGTAMTVYTAIHTLYSLCEIVLHREYIPFIALRCEYPIGPLDEPTFPKEEFDVPEGFWEESAEHLFRAARNVMEIVQANSERGFSIESPQVGFAIWTAAFVGVYSLHFPHMDTGGHMNGNGSQINFSDAGDTVKGATGLAVRTLAQMGPKMKMAYGWSKTVKRMHEYFNGIIEDYKRSTHSENDSAKQGQPKSMESRKLSLREGGRGGGLEEYKLLEKELKEFGSIEEDERHTTPSNSERTESRASTSGPQMTPTIKAEASHGIERTPTGRPGSNSAWAAVNNNKASSNADGGRPSSYPLYGSAQAESNAAQDGSYYQPHSLQQPGSKCSTSDPPVLIGAQAVNPDSSSFRSGDIATIQPTDEAYPLGPQQHLAHFASSSQHTQPLHSAAEHHTWPPAPEGAGHGQADYSKSLGRIILGGSQIAGFSDGLPYNIWTDEEGTYSETDFMQVLWPQAPYFST